MTKTTAVHDFAGRRLEFQIHDFEYVLLIEVSIFSGNESIKVIYKDGTVVTFDPTNSRRLGNFQGEYILPLDKIDEFSSLGNSYANYKKYKLK